MKSAGSSMDLSTWLSAARLTMMSGCSRRKRPSTSPGEEISPLMKLYLLERISSSARISEAYVSLSKTTILSSG